MIKQLWSKTITIQVNLFPEDVANEEQPLPLLFEASYHHYIGIYTDLITSFFHRYIPYPINTGEIWLQLVQEGVQLLMTDIVYNLYSLYKPQDRVLKLYVHFRRIIQQPVVDLMQYFQHQLKAATCIRNKKQAATILLSNLQKHKFNQLYLYFKDNNFDDFLGDQDIQNQKIGFKIITKKQDFVPLIILTKDGRITRQFQPNTRLSDIKNMLTNQNITFSLLGIPLNGNPNLADLSSFLHPDGFLYLVISE